MPEEIKKAFDKNKRDTVEMESFGFRLHSQFCINKAYRRDKEVEWLSSLRQYKGIYDPEVKLDALSSKVYPKITRSKENIVLSRLHEMLFPDNDRNWIIEPTPEPRITKQDVMVIAKSLVTQDEQGNPQLPTPDDLKVAIKKYAKDRCDKMMSEMDDQLIEMDYPEETKKVLRSGLRYGTGILKGPMIANRTKRTWMPSGGGEYEESVDNLEVPDFQFVRIWDWYPDLTVTDVSKMEGSFERHVMNKHDLRKLAKRDDFDDEEIYEYMSEHPNGDYVAENWEVDLQTIEVESANAGGQRTHTSVSGGNTDASRSTNRQLGKKYELLEFWGYVDGSDLKASGLDIDDMESEYSSNIWLLGKKIIKATLFDNSLDRYKLFYYEKDETSIYGEGLARVMRHSQIAVAAGARMVLDNAACVAGPQVEVNWSLMTEDTDLTSFYPRKLWYRKGTGVEASYPALRGVEFSSHIEELIKIIELFKQFGDEETTLPTWLISQMTNNETAQAASGRLSNITISIKDIARNFDSFTESVIRDLYSWNMEFNPRNDIKGDFSCKPLASASLVMKEIRMQALVQLKSTMTPEDWDYVPRREFLQEQFRSHDININLLSEEEVSKTRKQREESIQNQLAIRTAEAEIKYRESQSLSQLSKAKKVNAEAVKEAQTPIEQPAGESPEQIQADLDAKEADLRRKEESHALDIQQKNEKHRTSVAIETTRVAHDIANKDKATNHAMMLKEKREKAAIRNQNKAAKSGHGISKKA